MMETETTMSLLQAPRPFVRGLALVLALVLALSGVVLAGCASSTLTSRTVPTAAAIASVRAMAPVSRLAAASQARFSSTQAQLQSAHQALAAQVVVAQAARYPGLSLAGSIGLGRSHSGGFTQQGSTWSLGPVQLTLPLFDAGQHGANESAARVEYDAAVISYQAALHRAVRGVEQALVALQSSAAGEGGAIGAARDFERTLAWIDLGRALGAAPATP